MTTTYRITEAGRRTGFSPAALRYYERIGVVAPAERTPAGYRTYDDRALARLGFIARAKQLGCTLEEVADLVAVWDGDRCAPVQDHLRAVVADKSAAARARITELLTLITDLGEVAGSLEGPAASGACDDQCGCTGHSHPLTEASADAGPASDSADEPPIACSLDVSAVPDRMAAWANIVRSGTRVPAADGVRLTFGPEVAVGPIAELAAAEANCCGFFTFTMTIEAGGSVLDVHAPADAQPVVDALFATAAASG